MECSVLTRLDVRYLATVTLNLAMEAGMTLHFHGQPFGVYSVVQSHLKIDCRDIFSKVNVIIEVMHTLAHNISITVTFFVYKTLGA